MDLKETIIETTYEAIGRETKDTIATVETTGESLGSYTQQIMKDQ